MRHGKLLVRGWIGPDGKPRCEAAALAETADAARAVRAARAKGEHAVAYEIESNADMALPELKQANEILTAAKLYPLSSW